MSSALKFIGIGDIHFKIRGDVPVEWQVDRYLLLIDTIVGACVEQGAIALLAGDQLDSIEPKKEEIMLFLKLLWGLEMACVPTYIVSGNHETIAMGESILDYLELEQFDNLHYKCGRCSIAEGVTLDLLNHDMLQCAEPPILEDGVNILLSHFRSNYNKFVREEVDVVAITNGYDIVIAGDIHDSFTFGNVWYTNNPVNKEFEETPNCGWLELTVENGTCTAKHKKLNLPALRKLQCEACYWPVELPNTTDYFKVTVTGEVEELREVRPTGENSRIERVPHKDSVALQEDELSIEAQDVPLQEDLFEFIDSIYTQEIVGDMVDLFKEVT